MMLIDTNEDWRKCFCRVIECFRSWRGAKMSNTKGVRKDRNICRIGCGRTGQRDYGWKGPAFNCCFGTVACLVEHKRLVGHASVARTCEYLPDQRNASLSLHLPYKPRSWPSYSLHFRLFQPHLGATGRHTHTCMITLHAKHVGSCSVRAVK